VGFDLLAIASLSLQRQFSEPDTLPDCIARCNGNFLSRVIPGDHFWSYNSDYKTPPTDPGLAASNPGRKCTADIHRPIQKARSKASALCCAGSSRP